MTAAREGEGFGADPHGRCSVLQVSSPKLKQKMCSLLVLQEPTVAILLAE